jgi:hypothetical protein
MEGIFSKHTCIGKIRQAGIGLFLGSGGDNTPEILVISVESSVQAYREFV